MKPLSSRNMKHAKLYRWIIEDIKDRYGIKIIHRKLKDSFGTYDTDKKIIVVDSEIRDTVFGMWVMFHECQHVIDYREGLYTDFYNRVLYGEIEGLNVKKIVWEAEWHCCSVAIRNLKKLGIDNHNQFCNKNWVKKVVLPIWVSYYSE